MKANELMIGDWVNEGTHNAKVYEFDRYEIRYEYVDSAYADIRTASRFLAECKPIPLTEEILKANGFTKEYLENAEYMWKHPQGCTFLTQYRVNGVICLEDTDIELNYVHQLQHALRLCGLSELADNFKVDYEKDNVQR